MACLAFSGRSPSSNPVAGQVQASGVNGGPNEKPVGAGNVKLPGDSPDLDPRFADVPKEDFAAVDYAKGPGGEELTVQESTIPDGEFKGHKRRATGFMRAGRFVQHGITTIWYPNGQKKSERQYLNGKEYGRTTFWYENGQKQAEFYVSGGKDDNVHIFSLDWNRHWSESGEPVKLGHSSGLGLKIGKEPLAAGGLAVTQNGEALIVANVYNDSVSVVDLHSRRVSAELDLRPGKIDAAKAGVPGGEYPFWVSIKGNATAYISCLRDREIVVVGLVGAKFRRVAQALGVDAPQRDPAEVLLPRFSVIMINPEPLMARLTRIRPRGRFSRLGKRAVSDHEMVRVRPRRLDPVDPHDALDVHVALDVRVWPPGEPLDYQPVALPLVTRSAEHHPVDADRAELAERRPLQHFAHRLADRREEELVAVEERHPSIAPFVTVNEVLIGRDLTRRKHRPVDHLN